MIRSKRIVRFMPLLIAGLSLFLSVGVVFAYTEHPGGTISANETWGSGTHYVKGNITVSSGIVFTVQPGVVVKFAPGIQLTVNGTLRAPGTGWEPNNSIVFTSRDDDDYGEIITDSDGSPAEGDWDGIYLYGYQSAQGIGEFDHCRIRYGGIASGNANSNVHFYYSDSGYFANSISEYSVLDGIRITGCSPQITGSEIRNNTRHGIYATGAGAPVLTFNNFTYNGDHAVYMATSTVPPVAQNNTGSDNGTNGFVLNGAVAQDQTWSFGSSGFPIVLIGSMNVNSGVTLTIPAGAVIKCDTGLRFTVSGRLDVNGTADEEVVFTSLKDDTCEGDTNADVDLTIPSPGDWDGIYLYGYQSAQGIGEFDHCRIRYGGIASGNAHSNVHFYYSDSGYFANSISEYSVLDGIRISGCSPQITGSEIRNNTRHGIYATGAGAPVLTFNNFTYNGDHAVYMATSTVPPVAQNNTGSDNGTNGFVLNGAVAQDQTWSFGSSGFPIVLMGSMNVNSGVTLTIPAGAVIKCDTGLRFTVSGRLDVNGTADEEVVFTSLKDDTCEGDTNADVDLTIPSPGDWDGIYLYGYQSAQGIGEFDHCRIRYGGIASGNAHSNVHFYYSDSGYFANSISEYSVLDGIRISGCSPQILNSTIANNVGYGLYASSGVLKIINSIVWGNISGGISGAPVVSHSDVQGGVEGEGNIDQDPLFLDPAAGDYHLDVCSPAIDAGDPVEILTADYLPGDLVVDVDRVTVVSPGDTVWITDGVNVESDEVAGVSGAMITLANGFSNAYSVAKRAYLLTATSDFSGEPAPNGRRINMGGYGGDGEAAPSLVCRGDLEGNDEDVDGADLTVFLAALGADSGDPGYNPDADFNSDGVVNGIDLAFFVEEFGRTDCLACP